MAEQSDKAGKYYQDWRQAEASYAEALAAFGDAVPPVKVQAESARELARSRAKADKARDKYFKRVLK